MNMFSYNCGNVLIKILLFVKRSNSHKNAINGKYISLVYTSEHVVWVTGGIEE